MTGGGGPSPAQSAAQQRSLELAERSEQRELARERSLKLRVLARLRERRTGQSGRRTLMFNPGRMDLGLTPAFDVPATASSTGPTGNTKTNPGLDFIRERHPRAPL